MDLSGLLPAGKRFRELWLPKNIVGSKLPSLISGGHPLTLTGATKGSTANGVHFPTGATSNISLGVLHNAAAKFWISLRYKLDRAMGVPAAYTYLWAKRIDNLNEIDLCFDPTNGRLYFAYVSAGVSQFSIYRTPANLAGVWYHVLASTGQTILGGAASDGARLRVDNGIATTSANATALPNGGNMVLAAFVVGDATGTLAGIEVDVVMGTDDLTATEEADLYKGDVPSDAVEFYPLDEGRGVTAYDRGSGGNNGTLGAGCTWDFDARKLVALSNDGINDYEASSSGVDISGDLSLVAVFKMKNTQDTALANSTLALLRVGANDYLKLLHASGTDGLAFIPCGGGTSQTLNYTTESVIDAYMIIVATLTLAGAAELIVNGSSVDTDTGVGAISGAAATAYLGATNTPDEYNLDKPLLLGLVDGALSAAEAKRTSISINQRLGLGLTI